MVEQFDDACRALVEREGEQAYKKLHGSLKYLAEQIQTCDEKDRGETKVCPCIAAIGLFVLEREKVS